MTKPDTNEAKHTPGPWEWNRDRTRLTGPLDDNCRKIVVSYDWVTMLKPSPPDEPDAHLIAAAPDLLAACKAITEAQNGPKYTLCSSDTRRIIAMQKIRAAVAKVTEFDVRSQAETPSEGPTDGQRPGRRRD